MEYMAAVMLLGCSPLREVANLHKAMDSRVEVTQTQVGLPVASDLQEEEVPEEAPGEEDLTGMGQPALGPPGLQAEVGGGDRHNLQTTMETAPMKTSIL